MYNFPLSICACLDVFSQLNFRHDGVKQSQNALFFCVLFSVVQILTSS